MENFDIISTFTNIDGGSEIWTKYHVHGQMATITREQHGQVI